MVKDLLRNLTSGSGPVEISDYFLVKSVEQGSANNTNKPYLALVLSDCTGSIDARKWDVEAKDKEILTANHIVLVNGVLNLYHGKPQMKVNHVEKANDSLIDRSLYVPTAPVPLDRMVEEVKDLVESIQDEEIKNVTKGVLNDNWKKYVAYPAAKSVHQAYEKGLIFHSLSVCKVALAIMALYPNLFRRDYIIAGTLMHDIGKVQELTGPVSTDYTRIGNLESHVNIGAMIVNRKCVELHVDQEKTDLLTHILLSHHGKPEYGSSVVPKTTDAYLVHLADDLDAKFNVMADAMKTCEPGKFVATKWMTDDPRGLLMYRPSFDKDEK